MSGALSGVKVIDLTRLLPGPFCTMILSDLGADVIRVEDPQNTDFTWFIRGFYCQLNRNKRHITLNLKHPKGREIFFKMVKSADVVVEQFRPGVVDRLGIGYEECKNINPKVVYASLSGYGSKGPYSERAGHDLNYIGLGGVLSITGTKDGNLVIPGVQVADLSAALFTAVGILSALFYADRKGEGQKLEVSMLESVLSLISMHIAEFHHQKASPPGPETMDLNGAIPNYYVYRTKDNKWMTLGALEEKFFRDFCEKTASEDLKEKAYSRGEEGDKTKNKIARIIASKTRDEWIRFIDEKGMDACFEPVLDFSELEQSPAVKSTGIFQELEQKGEGIFKVLLSPIKLSKTPAKIYKPAEKRGESTEAILKELGYSQTEIQSFKEQGVI